MTLQEIKSEFFAYRNGIIADVLRSSGYPHGVIFGLNLPQLSALARRISEQTENPEELRELALQLWADKNVRESRMLSCYLFPPEEMSQKEAVKMALDSQTREEADMVAFRILKRRGDAHELLENLRQLTATDSSARQAFEALLAHLS